MHPELELVTDATSRRERMIGNLIILIIKIRSDEVDYLSLIKK